MAQLPQEINWSDVRRRSLFIATPMYGGLNYSGFNASVMKLQELCLRNGIAFRMHSLSNESLIQRARSYVADEFLRSGMTHLMFIDADIEFNPQDVLLMLAISAYDSTYDIVCAPYPKKNIAWEKVLKAAKSGAYDNAPEKLEEVTGDFVFNLRPNPDGSHEHTFRLNEPQMVSEAGTGMMMIQRKALEIWADTYPELYYRPDHKRQKMYDGHRKIMEFFACPVDRGTTEVELWRLLKKAASGKSIQKEAQEALLKLKTASLRLWSEDYAFCQYATRAGLSVWMCPWVKTKHYGTYAFTGSLAEVLRSGASPTVGADFNAKK